LSKKNVVLAIYENEMAAESAVDSLKRWDKSSDDVKLGAMGVLVLDETGEVKTHKMGTRSVRKGAGIGLVLGMLTPVGLAAGVVGGGLAGGLHRKGLGFNDEDRDRIAAELSDGKAAVGVLAKTEEAPAIAEKMKEFGGVPEVHTVDEAALEKAATEKPKAG
jgi:uncharacterized membrane protein